MTVADRPGRKINPVADRPVADRPVARLIPSRIAVVRSQTNPVADRPGRKINPVADRRLLRTLGSEDRAAKFLFTAEELARNQRMTFDEMAEDALAVKCS
jgi:hypothetical protein